VTGARGTSGMRLAGSRRSGEFLVSRGGRPRYGSRASANEMEVPGSGAIRRRWLPEGGRPCTRFVSCAGRCGGAQRGGRAGSIYPSSHCAHTDCRLFVSSPEACARYLENRRPLGLVGAPAADLRSVLGGRASRFPNPTPSVPSDSGFRGIRRSVPRPGPGVDVAESCHDPPAPGARSPVRSRAPADRRRNGDTRSPPDVDSVHLSTEAGALHRPRVDSSEPLPGPQEGGYPDPVTVPETRLKGFSVIRRRAPQEEAGGGTGGGQGPLERASGPR